MIAVASILHLDLDEIVSRLRPETRLISVTYPHNPTGVTIGADELAALVERLDRFDRASAHGPWTRATLHLIAAKPGVVSTDLAEELGRDRPSFKVDVRKLKRLGLTYSLERGYRITPKGATVLASLGS